MYKLIFSKNAEKENEVKLQRLSGNGDHVYRVGLGLLSSESGYLGCDKALYICGSLDGIYGFFRSFDDGHTWEKINDERQQFGDINSIDGDSRCFGRFFIATGSFGLKYGEPV